MARHAAPLFILLFLLNAVPTSAQSTDERARLHFQSGTSYFEAGEYESALREFEKSYELSGRPLLLYNLFLAHERLGHLEDAVGYLERFLTEVPDEPRRPVLEQKLANLRKRMEQERAAALAEAEDRDRRPDPFAVEPPIDRERRVGKAPSSPPRRTGMPVSAIASFTVGGAGLIASLAFGARAWAKDRELSDVCNGACAPSEVTSLRTYNTIADVGLGLAIVGGGLGVFFWLTKTEASLATEKNVSFAPWVGPSIAGLEAGGRF